LTLPTAVMAARGSVRFRRGVIVLSLVSIGLVIPGWIFAVQRLAASYRGNKVAFSLPTGDGNAIDYLDRAKLGGGVLSPELPSIAIPALTGRPVWIGHPIWTRAFDLRANEAAELFRGRLTARTARRRVVRIGARWVLAPCGSNPLVSRQLRPLIRLTRRFGCARVLLIDLRGRSALLRAARRQASAQP
jgi:hypothetical protein